MRGGDLGTAGSIRAGDAVRAKSSLLRSAGNALADTFDMYCWLARIECHAGRRRWLDGSEPRHLLLLARELPPLVSGGVYRPTSFLKFGPRFGWKVTAIGGPFPNGEADAAGAYLRSTIPRDVTIAENPSSRLSPAWKLCPRLDGGLLNALSVFDKGVSMFRGRAAPAVVLASGPPFYNFVAARYLAAVFGSSLVLDYRDEWTAGTPAFVDAGGANSWWERRCLSAADRVLYSTEGLHDLYDDRFAKFVCGKGMVLRNGWDSEDFVARAASAAEPGSPEFQITFVGRTSNHMLPGGFLQTLDAALRMRPSLVERVRVQFVGRQGGDAIAQIAQFKRRRPASVDVIDEVPKPEAIELMLRSSALLLINEPKHERVLASKLYEYVATGRPILVYGDTGLTGQTVKEICAGIVVPIGDPAALATAITTLVDAPPDRWVGARRTEWANQHTRENLARRLYSILEREI